MLKTNDGKQQGKYEDASKAEKDAWLWTVNWDDIQDLAAALKALEKDLPKEFRGSPDYSGPGKFLDEAKKYIGPRQEGKPMSKQMEGKNKPALDKVDSEDVINEAEKNNTVVNHSIRSLPPIKGIDGYYYFEEERVVNNYYYRIIPVTNGERHERVLKEELYEKTKK